jgi:hypothetical protein
MRQEEGRKGNDAIIFRFEWYRAKDGFRDFHICWENEVILWLYCFKLKFKANFYMIF